MAAFYELSPVALCFLFVVLIFFPVSGVVGYLRIRAGAPLRPKRLRYRIVITVQVALLLVTLAAAHKEGIELLGRTWGHPLIWIGALTYLALIALRMPRAWEKKSAARLEQARRFLPDDPSLMRLWVGIAATAGVSEECAYRGLAYRLLVGRGLNAALALLLCVVCFAIGHMTQGWRAVPGTFLLALIFHGLVFATHGLYLAIVFHAAWNLIIGTLAIKFLSLLPKPEQAVIA